MLYDLSPPISPALAVWPGDTPPSREVLQELTRGDAVDLSTLRATVHLGSHADAPSHFARGEKSIAECPLDTYLGPCQVIRVPAQQGGLVTPSDLRVAVTAPRVLLATGTYPDPSRFNRDFAALHPDLIDALAASGVRLIGVDTPSVDPADSKSLTAHHRCLSRGIAILEGLVLDQVPEGIYELVALPLRLEGFDASPVRAVLRSSR
ncbi:MAG: cyclase family protein [Gemmatimonadales bacterium]